jgi:hypothetical protein
MLRQREGIEDFRNFRFQVWCELIRSCLVGCVQGRCRGGVVKASRAADRLGTRRRGNRGLPSELAGAC